MSSISDLVEETDEVEQPTAVPVVEEVAPESAEDFKVQEVKEDSVTVTASTNNDTAFLDLLLNKIEDLSDHKTKLKMMIYSDPGAGKTTFLGQIPNNLIIDAESGTDSILNHKDIMGEGTKRLAYKTFEGLERTVETFHKFPDQLSQFSTISIDSMSNLHKRGLAEVVEREWRKAPSLNNRYVAETEHHTENNEHIRRLVQSLVDLDMNFVMTSHARTIEPKGKPAKTFPDFSEKLANTLAGMVGIVAYMYKAEVDGKEQRVMKFHPSNGISAKCRFGSFPVNLIDPTWVQVRDLLEKHGNE